MPSGPEQSPPLSRGLLPASGKRAAESKIPGEKSDNVGSQGSSQQDVFEDALEDDFEEPPLKRLRKSPALSSGGAASSASGASAAAPGGVVTGAFSWGVKTLFGRFFGGGASDSSSPPDENHSGIPPSDIHPAAPGRGAFGHTDSAAAATDHSTSPPQVLTKTADNVDDSDVEMQDAVIQAGLFHGAMQNMEHAEQPDLHPAIQENMEEVHAADGDADNSDADNSSDIVDLNELSML